MKALASVLLAFALAAGVGNEAGARQCSNTKHVTKTSTKHKSQIASKGVKQKSETACVCKPEKSKLVLTGRLTEKNSLPTNCVCPAGKVKTKQVASTNTTNTIKSKEVAKTGVLKTKSYGGYKRTNNTMINTRKGSDMNGIQNRNFFLKPYVDSLNKGL